MRVFLDEAGMYQVPVVQFAVHSSLFFTVIARCSSLLFDRHDYQKSKNAAAFARRVPVFFSVRTGQQRRLAVVPVSAWAGGRQSAKIVIRAMPNRLLIKNGTLIDGSGREKDILVFRRGADRRVAFAARHAPEHALAAWA